jgi:prevent-host-death family protein
MDEIAISKFKATCLAVLERVRKTRKPIRITKFGVPIAEVVPATSKAKRKSGIGCMEGTIRITGDIVAPAGDEKDWEVLNS